MVKEPLTDPIVVASFVASLGIAIKFAGDIGINAVALATLTLWSVFLLAVRLTLVMFGV